MKRVMRRKDLGIVFMLILTVVLSAPAIAQEQSRPAATVAIRVVQPNPMMDPAVFSDPTSFADVVPKEMAAHTAWWDDGRLGYDIVLISNPAKPWGGVASKSWRGRPQVVFYRGYYYPSAYEAAAERAKSLKGMPCGTDNCYYFLHPPSAQE